jgi:hypothetical protein
MTAKHKYTLEELDNAAIADQIADAECAERQAAEPQYAHLKDSLLTYAAECRARVDKYRSGGMHKVIVSGATS